MELYGDIPTLLWYVGFDAFIPFSILTNYANAALIEWDRFLETERRGEDEKREVAAAMDFMAAGGTPPVLPPRRAHTQGFMELHFFFICAGQVKFWVVQLVRIDGGADLKELWKRRQPAFGPLKDARDFLEHRGKTLRAQQPNLGARFGTAFTFTLVDNKGQVRDVEVDLRTALAPITETYEEIVATILRRPRRRSSARSGRVQAARGREMMGTDG